MAKNIGWIGLLVLAALLATVACPGRQAASEDATALELRAYTVPDGFDAGQIRSYVQRSLARGDTTLGTAVTYPDGTLVVTAPAGVHNGVSQLLQQLEQRGPARATIETTVAIRYWVLVARPVAAAKSGERVRLASELLRAAPLRPVLDELAAAQGPLEFALLEQLRLVSLDGSEHADVRGRRHEIKQRVMRSGGGDPIADINIRAFGSRGVTHSLDTRVRLEEGKFIVLAQTAYNPRDGGVPEGWSASDDLLLYYVISAETV